MKRVLLILLVCLSACKQLSSGKYDVKYIDGNNVLIVNNFIWGYGTTAINQFSGDFETLDKEIFEALKGKQGTCTVRFKTTEKNKYGADTTTLTEIGELNLSELNKYQTWDFWHKTGGIKTLLYNKYIQPQEDNSHALSLAKDLDTIAIDSSEYFEHLKQQSETPTLVDEITTETYEFTYAELYPLKADYDEIAPNGPSYEFKGAIKEVKEFTDGTLVLISVEDGEFKGSDALVMFYPQKCSSITANRFIHAALVGAAITAKCVQATSDTFDLVSAKIIFN